MNQSFKKEKSPVSHNLITFGSKPESCKLRGESTIQKHNTKLEKSKGPENPF